MGGSAAQTHPGSPCLLSLRLLIGLTTLPCCSYAHIHTDTRTVGGQQEETHPCLLTPLLSVLPALPQTSPLFYWYFLVVHCDFSIDLTTTLHKHSFSFQIKMKDCSSSIFHLFSSDFSSKHTELKTNNNQIVIETKNINIYGLPKMFIDKETKLYKSSIFLYK